jgi:hypothetical protein
MKKSEEAGIPKFIRYLMPDATMEDLSAATERFRRYMAVVKRIRARLHREAETTDSLELKS